MRPRGRQTVTVIERVPTARRGDWRDSGARTSWPGWSVQPMPAAEQEQLGLQVTRRWRAYGPPVSVPDTYQVEVDDVLDVAGVPLRLDVHGAIEVWPDGRLPHAEGVFELVEGASR